MVEVAENLRQRDGLADLLLPGIERYRMFEPTA